MLEGLIIPPAPCTSFTNNYLSMPVLSTASRWLLYIIRPHEMLLLIVTLYRRHTLSHPWVTVEQWLR